MKECGFITDKDKAWHETRHHANLVKLSRAPFEFISNTNKTRHKFADWWEGREITPKHSKDKRIVRFTDVLRELNNCVNPIWDAFEFLSKAVLYIPKPSIELLKGINGGALFLGMGWNLVENFQIATTDLSKYQGDVYKIKREKVTQALLKLVSQVAYVAIGVMITLSVFSQVVFAPVWFTACSATTVVFGILEYYHENLGKKIN
ncbi:MAG: hypothetical protein K1000chlam2_01319 [Chlamydiae bacterium]|nr:hypothetical protein [Chlamydiota bacterium]